MPWVAIILTVVVLAGIIGVFLAKVDELSGLGRQHDLGSFRWPHGRLLRSRVLHVEEDFSRRDAILKVLVPCVVIAVVCAVLIMWGPLTAYGNVLTVISLLASLVIASFSHGQKQAGRAFAYAVICLACACTILVLITNAYSHASTAEVNAYTTLFGAVGASVGASAMPPRVVFAREFEDEHMSCVRLSQRSTAALQLLKVEDKSWNVPAQIRDAGKRLFEGGRLAKDPLDHK